MLDQVLVIDIEATCWEGPPPAGQESEIIEIGICPFEILSGRRLEKRSILVKPEQSRVSAFCRRLTGLTQEQVDKGISFGEACLILKRDYLSDKRVWASYGNYDRLQFERQCRYHQIEYPFGADHINLKLFFALLQELRYVSLLEALNVMGHSFEGSYHRGSDDAWNAAGIFAEILKRHKIGGNLLENESLHAVL